MTTTELPVERNGTDLRDEINPTEPQSTSRIGRLLRGKEDDPMWIRPTLMLLLVGTLVLYLWGLSANGWGNSFYAAAVQAGSKSWKAFFFGSSDAGSTITVDKPPGSLWPAELSVRLFGLSSWSLLVPQALMGVATVATIYAIVRRWFTAGAGLLAGLVVALTPVAALMFRFNNPDALLALLMTLGAYFALRAVEEDRLRWYVLTGVVIGFGFLTKQLQVGLVVPGFALTLLIAGQGNLWRRIRGLVIAGVTMLVSAGWWVAIVQLWPKASRPYIGGTQHNSFLELTFGYNGFGRITGNEATPFGGGSSSIGRLGSGFSPFGGSTGITRLFNGVVGTQISWLIPVALVALVAGLWLRGRSPRNDMQRASLVLWGSWLVATGLVFSFMGGIFHEYYTVALAPAIGALVGIGASMLWQRRGQWVVLVTAAIAIGVTTWWTRDLLSRVHDWNSWLSPVITVAGATATMALMGLAIANAVGRRPAKALFGGVGVLAIVAALASPAAWAMQTAATPHSGSIVTAGPSVSGGSGRAGLALPGGFPGGRIPGLAGGRIPGLAGGRIPDFPGGRIPDFPGGGFPGFSGKIPGLAGAAGEIPGAAFGGSPAPSAKVIAALNKDANKYEWVAATVGAASAAPYQLATQHAVMPIGGFSGSDPAPTLNQFKQDVAERKIHWFIAAGGLGGNLGGSTSGGAIGSWVTKNFKATTIAGITLYDLSGGSSVSR